MTPGLNVGAGVADPRDMLQANPESVSYAIRPSRISLWPAEDGRYGIDFTYQGPTSAADAEQAHAVVEDCGLRSTVREEHDGAWTVRMGPLPTGSAHDLLSVFVV